MARDEEGKTGCSNQMWEHRVILRSGITQFGMVRNEGTNEDIHIEHLFILIIFLLNNIFTTISSINVLFYLS